MVDLLAWPKDCCALCCGWRGASGGGCFPAGGLEAAALLRRRMGCGAAGATWALAWGWMLEGGPAGKEAGPLRGPTARCCRPCRGAPGPALALAGAPAWRHVCARRPECSWMCFGQTGGTSQGPSPPVAPCRVSVPGAAAPVKGKPQPGAWLGAYPAACSQQIARPIDARCGRWVVAWKPGRGAEQLGLKILVQRLRQLQSAC